jgi:hypothetical protein
MVEKALLDLSKRFMASQFPIWGVDGSRHMDRIETAKFPDVTIVPDLGGSFIYWKATQGAGDYGFVDRTFLKVWQLLREYNQRPGKFVARYPFHFWDYCPNNYVGSAELFGALQGKFFWNTIKADPGEIKGFLDAESFVAWFMITQFNNSKPMQIARGFVKEYSYLSGGLPGLYTNLGLLPFFGDFFKDMDLDIAWYNKKRNVADIKAVMAKCGWRGKLRFRQYASDGDIDEDGAGDGLRLGMEEKSLDLNIWVDGGMEEFSAYCGQTTVPVVSETTTEDNTVDNIDEVKTMAVKNKSGLNIRSGPSAGPTPIIGWLPDKSKVHCIQTIKYGSDIWRKRAEGGYCAEVHNGITYLV